MIEFLGKAIQNLILSVRYLFSGNARLGTIITQAAAISYDSLIISLVIVFVSAAVIAIQVSKQFLMTGAEAYVGGSIAIVMIREIAPGFVALAIGARAGTAISAEIANMQVTSQVDAIKTFYEGECEILEQEAADREAELDEEQVTVEAQMEAISQEMQAVSDAISNEIQNSTIKLS
jgi:hypothetical protein